LVLIRRSQPAERHSIRALVESVLNEVYGGVWTQSPLSADEEEWALAWVAVSGTTIIGMVLTHEEWISDLSVLREQRGCGVSRLLLLQGEAEIADRGYQTLRLRVVKETSVLSRSTVGGVGDLRGSSGTKRSQSRCWK
jgi:GNAT superfamily N-acetyltransferase